MFREEEKYYIIEEFEKNGVIAAYTKKNAGNMSDFCFNGDNGQVENREEVIKILGIEGQRQVFSHQRHTNDVKIIEKNTEKLIYDGIDGFITDRKDIAIFTFYADCLPLFFLDIKNKVIGVAHSGWPGTYKEMLKTMVLKMKGHYGTEARDILLGVGIGISVEDYEVGNDFYEKFYEKFEKDLVENSFMIKKETGKYHFDNIKFNKLTALKLGIPENNIIVSEKSTMENEFHSHRRDKEKAGRAAGIVAFR